MKKELHISPDLALPLDEQNQLRGRLLANIKIDNKGCWVWQRSTKNGYGQLSVHDYPTYTHRLAYELFVGHIPDGKFVLHRCDVKRCINPDHLFIGTHDDNVADMWEKGRGSPPPRRYGENNHKATLTDSQVEEVRKMRNAGVPQRRVAKQFRVSQSTVWRIAHNLVRVQETK